MISSILEADIFHNGLSIVDFEFSTLIFKMKSIEAFQHLVHLRPVSLTMVKLQVIILLLAILLEVDGIEFDSKPWLLAKLGANETMKYDLPASSKKSVLVVFWSVFYSTMDSWMWWFREPLRAKTCPHLPCFFTSDHNLLPLADAVLFHGYESTDPSKPYKKNFPSYRSPKQKWIFITSEVPKLNNYTAFDGIFNWTMTYRRDSNVFMNYGRTVLTLNATKMDADKNYADGKTKLAAWMCSHCRTASRRELYVEELQKYMGVDVYGSCGNLTCGYKFYLKDCSDMLTKNYKFYLAFENSMCKDYVTEKLTNILSLTYVVPITFGGTDYKSFLPEHSYINALDFQSPKDLADYIKMLDNDDDLYNKYFDWKRGYDVQFVRDYDCDLCQKLLDLSIPSTTIEKFNDWWLVEANCTAWMY